MIKLQIEDATLLTLDPALLPHVQWKSLRMSDLEGVSSEVLSKYLFKMSQPVIKSLLKSGRATTESLTTEDWVSVLNDAYNNNWGIMQDIQIPYSAIQAILADQRQSNRWAGQMAIYQTAMPVADAMKHLNAHSLNHLMFHGNNPAITHYITTDEGKAALKAAGIRYADIRYLTTTEMQTHFGVSFKNRRISVQSLNRASACDGGKRYLRDVLRELGRDSITWDEAIIEIRNNAKLRNRNSLQGYVDWVHDRSRHLEEA